MTNSNMGGADLNNQQAKNMLADTLEQLGYQAENAMWRNEYLMGPLSCAMAFLIIGDVSYEVFARNITKAGQKDQQTYEIYLGGQRFEVSVEDERTMLLARLTSTGAGSGESTVQAPMPGLVIGVTVEQGAEVRQGQTVVVLEAMKMENDLAAPGAGVVKEVRVSKGQTVDQGEVLVVIEPTE